MLKAADKPLLLVLLVFQLLWYISDGWLSKVLLNIAGYDVNFWESIKIAVLGVVGSQFVPLAGGSMATYYLFRRLDVPAPAIFFLMITWSILIGINYVLFFLVSLILLPATIYKFIPPQIFIVLSLLLAAIILLLIHNGRLFIILWKSIGSLINKLSKKTLVDINWVEVFVGKLFASAHLLIKNKLGLAKAATGAFLFFAINLTTLYLSFLVFGFKPHVFTLIFGFMTSMFLALITLAPETPGVMEASLTAVFVSLGFPTHITVFSLLLFRTVSFWLPLAFGIWSFLKLRKENIIKLD